MRPSSVMQNKTSNTSQQAAKRSGRGGHCELRGRRLFLSADRPPLDRASVMRHSLANRNKVFAFGRRLVRGLEIAGVVAAAIVVIPILLPIYTIACGRGSCSDQSGSSLCGGENCGFR